MSPDENVEGDRACVASAHLLIVYVPRQRQLPLSLVVLAAGTTEKYTHRPRRGPQPGQHPTQVREVLDHSSITDKEGSAGRVSSDSTEEACIHGLWSGQKEVRGGGTFAFSAFRSVFERPQQTRLDDAEEGRSGRRDQESEAQEGKWPPNACRCSLGAG